MTDQKMRGYWLQYRKKLPLEIKEGYTRSRIMSFYNKMKGDVYISFSGGKDSTVLLHQVRKIYPHVPAVFIDTGLEYPEIREFVKTINNVTWLKPKMNFKAVLDKYGYPVISKENSQKIYQCKTANSKKTINTRLHGGINGKGKIPDKWKYLLNADFKISDNCCNVMKKIPIKKYEKESNRRGYIGTMTSDSALRLQSYIRYGCNSFNGNRIISRPLSFWVEHDIWNYIKKYNIPYSKIYDMGYDRTGCMFCMYGIHLEKYPNRFQKMKKTHPKIWEYCIYTLGCGKVLDYMRIPYTEDTASLFYGMSF